MLVGIAGPHTGVYKHTEAAGPAQPCHMLPSAGHMYILTSALVDADRQNRTVTH